MNTGEAGDGDDVFAIDVWGGATGLLVHAESAITLRARRWMRANTLLAAWAPWVEQGWARVRRVAGTNPFLASAVVNDDGAFLAASED